MWLDPDAGVGDLDDDLMLLVVPGGNFEPAALGREFRGVLDQVPKNLLQTRRVAPAMMFAGFEALDHLDTFFR